VMGITTLTTNFPDPEPYEGIRAMGMRPHPGRRLRDLRQRRHGAGGH
jgi:hypothetical protein